MVNFIMYICPECRRIFKVKGNDKRVKCSKCRDSYLKDLRLTVEEWEKLSKDAKNRYISNVINPVADDKSKSSKKTISPKAPVNNARGIAFKCKMCGGQLEVMEDEGICTCDYCGTTQTLPSLSDEKRAILYDRANHFRRNNEFDKAMGIYEHILSEDQTDAEAYWSIVLCRYGIEYVKDPTSGKHKPTINRTQPISIFNDTDYLSALENADKDQKSIYVDEAKEIDRIQREIMSIVHKEQPFDIFISYKETSSNGQRTKSSVLAQDLYEKLVESGYRVFFSRITLEDKLGQQFEPYIYSALSTSKVMLVVGTDKEEFNAPWVKNEWSRFLGMMKNDREKLLIPCYRDIDAYDLPEEMTILQSQDMSRVGFAQDLIRGIRKVIKKDKDVLNRTDPKIPLVVNNNLHSLMQRGNIALEDHEWDRADDFFEEVLNQDPKYAEAYLGKLMAKCKCSSLKSLETYYIKKHGNNDKEILLACDEDAGRINAAIAKYEIKGFLNRETIKDLYKYNLNFDSYLTSFIKQKEATKKELSEEKLLSRAKQYANGEIKTTIDILFEDVLKEIDGYISKAESENKKAVYDINNSYSKHLDEADIKVEELYKKAGMERYNVYQDLLTRKKEANDIDTLTQLKDEFEKLNDYEESSMFVKQCDDEIQFIQEKHQKDEEKSRKRKGILLAFGFVIAVIVVILLAQSVTVGNAKAKYNKSVALFREGNYDEALQGFSEYEKLRSKLDNASIASIEGTDSGDVLGKYRRYARILEKLDRLPYVDEPLLDIYNDIKSLGSFENADQILETNRYFKEAMSMEGTWVCPDGDKLVIKDCKVTWTMSDGFAMELINDLGFTTYTYGLLLFSDDIDLEDENTLKWKDKVFTRQ